MKNSNYKVSIITVVYNGAKTIEKTILSVLGQTYKNIEYIIIDGQSTDGTQQVIEKYMDFISLFVSERDSGIYDAMNKGIQRATGDIIGIINSDDWYDRNAVENIVQFFSDNDADVAYGRMILVHQDGKTELLPITPLETIWYQMAVPHPTVFIKREIYERFGLFHSKYKLSADYELLLRFYSKQVKFGFIDTIITYFSTGGISSRRRNEGMKEHIEISLNYFEKCPCKSKILPGFDTWYRWTRFHVAIHEQKQILPKLLRESFCEPLNEVVIFGTGIWGDRCYTLLRHEKIRVRNFADNNSLKWNQTFHNLKIINPNELRYEKTFVLIAVRNNGEEIKQQLKNMGNEQLKSVTLVELEELFRVTLLEEVKEEWIDETGRCGYNSLLP